MSLPWVRLDTGFADNPKVLGLVADRKHRAVLAYLLGLAYSGKHELDGFIPRGALSVIHATAGDARSLVDARLWHATDGGWLINGWDEFQISSEESQRRRDKAQKAAMKRWHGGDE